MNVRIRVLVKCKKPHGDGSMKPMYTKLSKPYSYASITQHCFEQIYQFVTEASRHTGLEARYRHERAYGVYMGWRALVAEHTEPNRFFEDDRRLESLLVAHQHGAPGDVQPE